jgi:hypothetical protein
MKRTITPFLLLAAFSAQSQTVLFTEDFGTGCSTGSLLTSYLGTGGAWTMMSGANGSHANTFYVSATEAGMGEGNCGDGCGNNPGLSNRTLHMGSVQLIFQSIEVAPADPGASYNAGGLAGLGFTCNTHRRAESPVFSTVGYTNLELTFLYMEGGDGTNDNGTVAYYDGTQWVQLEDLPKTDLSCAPQGTWTKRILNLPTSLNNNANVRVAFEWVNNDDGLGTDPSFAIDDIEVTGDISIGINEAAASDLYISENGAELMMNASGLAGLSVLTLRDVTGRVLHTSGLDLKGDDRVSLPHLSHQGMVVLTLSTPQGNRTVRYISK